MEMDSCLTCNYSLAPDISQTNQGYFSLSDLAASAPKGCRLCSLLLAGLTAILPKVPIELFYHSSVSTLSFQIEGGSWAYWHDHGEPRILRLSVFDFQGQKPSYEIYSNYMDRLSLLEIHTLPGTTPSLFCHEASEVTLDLDIAQAVGRINDWMAICKNDHTQCLHGSNTLPRRVLDMSSLDTTGKIYLVETSGETGEYTALSHCWGKNNKLITSTTENISARKAGIALSDLPRTFQDSVQLTFELKIKYIWIDSLCILQDSKRDWEVESSQMAQIYANSTINIASTAGYNGECGLFGQRWTPGYVDTFPVTSYEIPGSEDKFGSTHYIRHSQARTHLDLAFQTVQSDIGLEESAPLLSRGWVLQERLLSPRTVHFHTGEMVWDCNSHFTCECGTFELDPTLPRTHDGYHQWMSKRSIGNAEDLHTITYRWHQMIEQYSELSLTEDSDILPAFSGVANHFKTILSQMHRKESSSQPELDKRVSANNNLEITPVQQEVPNQYLAGLWQRTLSRNLLWYIRPSNVREPVLPRRTIEYRGPTWSWVSMDLQHHRDQHYLQPATLNYVHGVFDEEPNFTILSAECSVVGANEFGAVTEGLLRLRGLVVEIPMVWDQSSLSLNIVGADTKPLNGHVFWPDIDISSLLHEPEKQFMLHILVLSVNKKAHMWKGLLLWKTDEESNRYIRIGCLNIYEATVPGRLAAQVAVSGVRTIELV